MKLSLSSLLVIALAAAASAQKAPKAAKPASCSPAPELEVSFQLRVPKAPEPVELKYAGCSEEDRDDLLSGYTERHYEGKDGYALTLVTSHGDGAHAARGEDRASDVLVSKGSDWVARFGEVANAELLSGRVFQASGFSLSSAKTRTPSTFACEAKLPKAVYGPNQLWLLTKTKAYFYREDCDICAELDSCDLATQAVKAEIVSHSVSCADLEPYRKGQTIAYDACAK